MADDYGTFQPDELMPMIPDLFVPGSFLSRTMFPGEFLFDTQEVYFDRVLTDRRRAPLVSPYSPGKVIQPRGFRKESIVPANYKPKNEITGKEVLSRLPGERIGGEMSATDRAAAIREKYLLMHQMRLTRSKEWQAAQLLQTGSMVLVSPDYPSTSVDYHRDAALTDALSGGARWGQTGVSPYDYVEERLNLVGEKSGAPGNLVIMDRLAWNFYIADPKAQKALDRTLGQTTALTLGFTPTTPGAPAFKGRDGDVEFYVYNDTQEADDGTPEKLLPDYSLGVVAMGGVEGAMLYGLPQHASNNYEKARDFPHNWIEEGTGAEFVETISAFVACPGRIDATSFSTVN
jgi:hypothetical protein